MTTAPARLGVHVRWMSNRDYPEVLAIEAASFRHPWAEEGFRQALRQRNTIGLVAEHGERVVGFVVYELHAAHLRVLNLAVLPACRRRGVGAQLVHKLIAKLSGHRRTAIELVCSEANLGGHLFCRALGFAAERVARGFYEEADEDGYEFAFRIPPGEE